MAPRSRSFTQLLRGARGDSSTPAAAAATAATSPPSAPTINNITSNVQNLNKTLRPNDAGDANKSSDTRTSFPHDDDDGNEASTGELLPTSSGVWFKQQLNNNNDDDSCHADSLFTEMVSQLQSTINHGDPLLATSTGCSFSAAVAAAAVGTDELQRPLQAAAEQSRQVLPETSQHLQRERERREGMLSVGGGAGKGVRADDALDDGATSILITAAASDAAHTVGFSTGLKRTFALAVWPRVLRWAQEKERSTTSKTATASTTAAASINSSSDDDDDDDAASDSDVLEEGADGDIVLVAPHTVQQTQQEDDESLLARTTTMISRTECKHLWMSFARIFVAEAAGKLHKQWRRRRRASGGSNSNCGEAPSSLPQLPSPSSASQQQQQQLALTFRQLNSSQLFVNTGDEQEEYDHSDEEDNETDYLSDEEQGGAAAAAVNQAEEETGEEHPQLSGILKVNSFSHFPAATSGSEARHVVLTPALWHEAKISWRALLEICLVYGVETNGVAQPTGASSMAAPFKNGDGLKTRQQQQQQRQQAGEVSFDMTGVADAFGAANENQHQQPPRFPINESGPATRMKKEYFNFIEVMDFLRHDPALAHADRYARLKVRLRAHGCKLLSSKMIEDVYSVFSMFDEDGSGVMDAEELTKMFVLLADEHNAVSLSDALAAGAGRTANIENERSSVVDKHDDGAATEEEEDEEDSALPKNVVRRATAAAAAAGEVEMICSSKSNRGVSESDVRLLMREIDPDSSGIDFERILLLLGSDGFGEELVDEDDAVFTDEASHDFGEGLAASVVAAGNSSASFYVGRNRRASQASAGQDSNNNENKGSNISAGNGGGTQKAAVNARSSLLRRSIREAGLDHKLMAAFRKQDPMRTGYITIAQLRDVMHELAGRHMSEEQIEDACAMAHTRGDGYVEYGPNSWPALWSCARGDAALG